MNNLLFLIISAFTIFSIFIVATFSFFGIWGAIGALLGFIFAVKLGVKYAVRRFRAGALQLFEAKSGVLRGANTKVHMVSNAPEIINEEEMVMPTKFYFIDVTITPLVPSRTTPFSFWDSSEIALVPYDAIAQSNPLDDAFDDEVNLCRIHDVAYSRHDEEDTKVSGEQRLKLHVEIPEGITRLKFRYYFEMFGEVTIP